MRKLRTILAAAALAAVAQQAAADATADCNQAADPALRVTGCTAVLAAPDLTTDDRAAALGNRANAYRALGEAHAALADYDAAIEVRPDAPAYTSRGAFFGVVGDMEAALADFEAALQLDPAYPDALKNRALIRANSGDLTGALDDLDAALTADPMVSGARILRAQIRCATGMTDGATADYVAAVEEGWLRAEDVETALLQQGHFSGPFTGEITPELRAALATWAGQGCK